jgi:hypothetical protein
MSQVKPYIIYLEVSGPDGRRFGHLWDMIPTGGSDTSLASFWMLLKASFEAMWGRYMKQVGAQGFSLSDHPDEPVS